MSCKVFWVNLRFLVDKSCPIDMLEAILYNMTVCKQLKDMVERVLRGSLKGGAKD